MVQYTINTYKSYILSNFAIKIWLGGGGGGGWGEWKNNDSKALLVSYPVHEGD